MHAPHTLNGPLHAPTEPLTTLTSDCRHCGVLIAPDGLGSWVDASDGDGCDPGVHEPTEQPLGPVDWPVVPTNSPYASPGARQAAQAERAPTHVTGDWEQHASLDEAMAHANAYFARHGVSLSVEPIHPCAAGTCDCPERDDL